MTDGRAVHGLSLVSRRDELPRLQAAFPRAHSLSLSPTPTPTPIPIPNPHARQGPSPAGGCSCRPLLVCWCKCRCKCKWLPSFFSALRDDSILPCNTTIPHPRAAGYIAGPSPPSASPLFPIAHPVPLFQSGPWTTLSCLSCLTVLAVPHPQPHPRPKL